MFNLVQNNKIDDYKIIVSNKRKFNNDFLIYEKKPYKIVYEDIKKDEIQIKNYESYNKIINIYDYKIANTILFIKINIVSSKNNEINEDELRRDIYIYLKDLYVYDKMKINLKDVKMMVMLSGYEKYYLINDETKIIFILNNNYKLYNNIEEIDNRSLDYIIFNISYKAGSFRRNLLDDINLLDEKDFYEELDKNLKNIYLNKRYNVISNNCEFEVKVSFIDLKLKDEKRNNISKTIYNFNEKIIKNKEIILDKDIYFSERKKKPFRINVIIEDGPKVNIVYDLDLLLYEINNKLGFNYIKVNDKFRIKINNDILTIRITSINLDAYNKIAYYISDKIELDTDLMFENNNSKKIFAYKPELMYNIESIDINILKYTDTNIFCMTFIEKKSNIVEIEISSIENKIRNTYFFYKYKDKICIDNYIFEYKNIKVKDKIDLNESFLLKIDYNTKINIIKDDKCNIKLIKPKILNAGCKLNMSIEEIRDIKNKLVENGLTGMDVQIDKIVKEIILPRSNFVKEGLKNIIKLPKGILLYGPSGTGKTSLAKKIAKIIGITKDRIRMLTAPEIYSKWVGESEGNIRNLFTDARKDINNLHLVIIDEIDSILKSRCMSNNESNKSDIVNQFLGEMDGLEDINNIIIIGITNKIEILDKAVLRPGRFGTKIYCGLPNEEERLNIIKLYHNRLTGLVNYKEINFENLLKRTEGFSGARIEDIYVKLVEQVIDAQFNESDLIITDEIFNNIITMIE